MDLCSFENGGCLADQSCAYAKVDFNDVTCSCPGDQVEDDGHCRCPENLNHFGNGVCGVSTDGCDVATGVDKFGDVYYKEYTETILTANDPRDLVTFPEFSG